MLAFRRKEVNCFHMSQSMKIDKDILRINICLYWRNGYRFWSISALRGRMELGTQS